MFEETGLRIDDPGPQVARREASVRMRKKFSSAVTLEVSAENWTEFEQT
jgi:hypothetical protein